MGDLDRLLQEEAEHAENNMDAEPGPATRITRPGRERAKVLSVRFNADEYERLSAAAEAAGVGASTFARGLVLAKLDETEPAETVTRMLDRVERSVREIEKSARIAARSSRRVRRNARRVAGTQDASGSKP